MRGIFGEPTAGARHFEFDYGIGQRLTRHHYLRPYHAHKYGLGNLLKDGETPVAWHQWYGSYRTRLREATDTYSIAMAGERAFLADFPQLSLDDLSPAWAPDRDVEAEQRAIAAAGLNEPTPHRVRRWAGGHLRVVAARIAVRRGRSRLK